MARADYQIVKVTDDAVYLHDLDLGRVTVTNDADAVYAEVSADHPGKKVIYRDSLGHWAQIGIEDGTFTYRPLESVEI